MLKSVFCFAFICALILAVHSQNAPLVKTDTGVTTEKNDVKNAGVVNGTVLLDIVTPTTVKRVVETTVKSVVETTVKLVDETTVKLVGDQKSDANNQKVTPDPKDKDIISGPGNVKPGHCIKCSQTASNTTEFCLNPPKNASSTACNISNKNNCFMQINPDGFVSRGCADELGIHGCGNRTNCKICTNDNCNNIIYPEKRLSCLICGPVDKNCSDSAKYTPKLCPKYIPHEKCYIADNKGSYERGCLSESKRCEKAGTCNLCNTPGCNKGVFNSANGQFSTVTIISFLFISFTMILVN